VMSRVKEKYGLNDEKRKEYVFEAEVYYSDTEELKEEFESLIKYMKKEILKEEFSTVMNNLRVAENKGNTEEAARFLKQCQEISKKINE